MNIMVMTGELTVFVLQVVAEVRRVRLRDVAMENFTLAGGERYPVRNARTSPALWRS